MHSYDLLCTAKSFWLKCALIFEVRSRRGPLCLCNGTKSVANARHINNWTHSTRMNMIRTAAHSWCSNYLGALKVLFFEPKVLYRAKIEGGMPVCLFNLRHGIKDSVFFVWFPFITWWWVTLCHDLLNFNEALNFELAPGPDSQVPVGDYELPIGQAEVVQEGTDATQLYWHVFFWCLTETVCYLQHLFTNQYWLHDM